MNKKKQTAIMIIILLLCCLISIPATAANKKGWVSKGQKWYYYNSKGVKVTGWLTLKGKTYYLRKTTGERAVGVLKIKNKLYYFKTNGVLKKKLEKAGWKENSVGRWYDYGDGTYPKKCWLNIRGKRYRFNAKGYAVTGWKKIKGSWYYFGKKGAMVSSKWVKSGSSYYYLGSNGKMRTNTWIGSRYVDQNGAWIKGYRDDTRTSKNKTGWVGYGRIWRYYKKGKAVVGWQRIKDSKGKKHWYFFDSNTYMKTGFYYDGKDYYFLDSRLSKIGIMVTGWIKINGNYYYFFSTGKMARNVSLSSGNKTYIFNEKGICTNFN